MSIKIKLQPSSAALLEQKKEDSNGSPFYLHIFLLQNQLPEMLSVLPSTAYSTNLKYQKAAVGQIIIC